LAAKDEKFFSWRWHLICTRVGLPVAFDMLHDRTALHELTVELLSGAQVQADKGDIDLAGTVSILHKTGVHLIAVRHKNMCSQIGSMTTTFASPPID
jgi:hypothetical protein